MRNPSWRIWLNSLVDFLIWSVLILLLVSSSSCACLAIGIDQQRTRRIPSLAEWYSSTVDVDWRSTDHRFSFRISSESLSPRRCTQLFFFFVRIMSNWWETSERNKSFGRSSNAKNRSQVIFPVRNWKNWKISSTMSLIGKILIPKRWTRESSLAWVDGDTNSTRIWPVT